jgi:transcriptional regulator with XRE-family HTH domain
MTKQFRDLAEATMPLEARKRAHRRAKAELKKMELAELRDALRVSQREMAQRLKVTQVAISRLERRENLQIGSVAKYVRALGGTLEIRAHVSGRTVALNHFTEPKARRSRRKSKKR